MATKTAEREIELPTLTLGRVGVKIAGLTPLLTNRFGETAIREIEAAQQGKAKLKKEPRNPDAIYREAMHTVDKEQERFGFPTAGLMKALVMAGGRYADEKMTVLRGALSIEGSAGYLLEILGPPPTMRTDPVRLRTGGWTIAYRPEFFPWEMDVTITYNGRVLQTEQVLNLIRIAGLSVGIGCWRPENGGTFGKFEIIEAREA